MTFHGLYIQTEMDRLTRKKNDVSLIPYIALAMMLSVIVTFFAIILTYAIQGDSDYAIVFMSLVFLVGLLGYIYYLER